MRLTVYTDYSLRLLMYLAAKEPESATITEAADRLGVSRNHLMKVAYRLGVAGYLRTLRGRSGGLRLAQPPSSIRLGDVIRYTETDMALVPCFAPLNEACSFLPECGLRVALGQATTAFLQVLDGITLADLIGPARPPAAAKPVATATKGQPPGSPAPGRRDLAAAGPPPTGITRTGRSRQ